MSELAEHHKDLAGEWRSIHRVPLRAWGDLRASLSKPLRLENLQIQLIRHGETVTNALGLVTGTMDVHLTEVGRERAVALGRAFKEQRFDAAWSSTLRRSIDTADIVLEASGNEGVPRFVDERLNERRLGETEGRASSFVSAYSEGDLLFAPPGGEPYISVTQRCLDFLLDVALLTQRLERRVRVVVFTHVGPMRILSGIATEATDPVPVLNASFENTIAVELELDELRFPKFASGTIPTRNAR